MGAHKGKKWADKETIRRYFAENHRYHNKIRRILKNNGPDFLEKWKADNPVGR